MRLVLLPSLLALLLPVAALGGPLSVSGEPARGVPADVAARLSAAQAFRDPGYPAAAATALTFAPIENSELATLRGMNAGEQAKRLTIGIERAPDATLGKAGPATLQWRPTVDGGRSARLSVRSPGAAALRVALTLQLPEGGELRFAGDDGHGVVAPIGAAELRRQQAIDPLLWTPVTEGDTQTIEIWLPPGADDRWLRLDVAALSHLLVSPTGPIDLSLLLPATKIGESQSCEFDAKCISDPPQAYLDAKNAVARMVFQTSTGGSALCTGTLLNDTDSSTQVPYFFSAAHCFTSQSEANTLTTFFFYEATGCGSGVFDSANARQLGGGAQVLYADTSSDVLFLRLNGTPPSGVYYLGWDAAAIAAGTEVVVIHHPAGDVKKVSLGQVTGIGGSSLASGSFVKAGYTDGTTEGGSSGCALMTFSGGEYRLRGGLLGGSASCTNSGTIGAPGNSDDYSRFDLVFDELQQFLAPATTQPPSNIDYSGAWFNPSESGWGLIVVRGASGIYVMYIYHYDQQSTPSWYLAAPATLSGTTFNASLLSFTGPWFGLVPFEPGAVTSRTSGNLSVDFSSATTATIGFTIDGRSVSTTLQKLEF